LNALRTASRGSRLPPCRIEEFLAIVSEKRRKKRGDPSHRSRRAHLRDTLSGAFGKFGVDVRPEGSQDKCRVVFVLQAGSLIDDTCADRLGQV
jgi:hypothetical protein